jgi:hypothetical protein
MPQAWRRTLALFLFEFMDQSWIPASLHVTLREVLGFHLRVPLGYYYRWAAAEALSTAEREGLTVVAELGAGAAGFSETLATLIRERGAATGVQISDLRPDDVRYGALERAFPGIVLARRESEDFAVGPLPPKGLLVMSAAFHHVPLAARPALLQKLAHRRVLIFESVTRTFLSMFGCAIGFLPALLTPVYFWRNPAGRWRRVAWCWLLPVAPLMVAWDGVVSCLRCWTEDEWRSQLQRAGVAPATVRIERRRLSHLIAW